MSAGVGPGKLNTAEADSDGKFESLQSSEHAM